MSTRGSLPDGRRLVAGALLVAILALVGVRWLQSDGRKDACVLGVDIWVGFGPLYLAEELGYFREDGLDVRFVTLKGTPEMRAALAAHEVDAVTTSLDTALRNRATGTAARVAVALDRSTGADGVVGVAGITTIADLRGREVAVQLATPSEFLLRVLLDRAGVASADVKMTPMDSADAGAAFVAGKVDAAVTWEPWLSKAAAVPGATLIASTATDRSIIVDVLVVRDDVLDQHPERVAALRRGWFRAVAYTKEHPDDAARRMSPHFGVDAAAFTDMISGLEYLDADGNRALFSAPPGPGSVHDVIEAANRIFAATGDAPKKVEETELLAPVALGN